jgi:hypothetical protein
LGQACPLGSTQLLQGDLGFGQKGDLLRNPGLLPAEELIGPGFGEVEAVSDRKASEVIGEGERNRDLAVGGLA